jgi:hypothetical protein
MRTDPGSASTKDYNFVFYEFPLEIVKDRNDWLRVRIKLWSEAISKFRYAFVFSVYIQKLYIPTWKSIQQNNGLFFITLTCDQFPVVHIAGHSMTLQRLSTWGLSSEHMKSGNLNVLSSPVANSWMHSTVLVMIPPPQVSEHSWNSPVLHLLQMQEGIWYYLQY